MTKRFTIVRLFTFHLNVVELLSLAAKLSSVLISLVMPMDFDDLVFGIEKQAFSQFALNLFLFQYRENTIYKAYADSLSIKPESIRAIEQIPFLPINFFKTHAVQTTAFTPEIIFESSGTTQIAQSKHFIKNLSLYRKSFKKGFEGFYGPIRNWCIIGLLPSYLERSNSSLVFMVQELINQSNHPQSGFFLNEYGQLAEVLEKHELIKQKTLLIGVTFALVDFAEQFSMKLDHTIVMETGGMKGRRKEITRTELHQLLNGKLGTRSVHSEYGMTELMSQAYSKADGLFETTHWMKVFIRNDNDPFDVNAAGEGILNIIDLANIYSCAFVATDDVGKVYEDGKFEVLGRTDHSDIRGCSQLII